VPAGGALSPVTPLPAFNVTPVNVTFVVFAANAAMLELPFPLPSFPVALAAWNVTFSIAIAAVELVNVSGIVFAGGATVTVLPPGAYDQLLHANPPYTVTATDDDMNATGSG
jgi:hypothetical protein